MKRCTVLGIVLVAVLVLFTISEARMYQPETGRYLQPDPAEFEGGDVNLYVYTRNNPVNLSDPWGLKTWMCSAPLHALGGTGARTGLDIPGNPLYHQYLCVTNGRGISCGGQDRTGDGAWYQPWSHGTPSDDKFNPKTCKDAEPDNKCMEQCVLKLFAGGRPRYSIGPFGTDCQEWADDAIKECRQLCKNR